MELHLDRNGLDFAYKYPFSNEARAIIATANSMEDRLVNAGRLRVEEDINGKPIVFHNTMMQDVKRMHVLSYVYSRMIISAMANKLHLDKYVLSEARRARMALEYETLPNMLKLTSELGMELGYSEERFVIKFATFLLLSSDSRSLPLVDQELARGMVYLKKENALSLMESAIAKEIRKNLPIPPKELPDRIIEESMRVRLPKLDPKVEIREGSYRWIEKVLSNPIADVRHRTVNLILAPYLTNIKGMDEDAAASIILEYIERCKQINPDTKVNSSYIKYQCKYAKSKGMKPLSLEKARNLFIGVLELD
ncbi:MAG: DNA primase noncatalytic subunit PriX [Candidatus Marsarchaeota archaeon]|nr:DNA primase noncatalytic subunit PriX [Candidatus Marsarchaeota archaeon]MCL5412858.1 DNA primase noncatalytic subunit PriX [Candidatus Marsarchaeota archaeon]